jgi:hypothetical protein
MDPNTQAIVNAINAAADKIVAAIQAAQAAAKASADKAHSTTPWT